MKIKNFKFEVNEETFKPEYHIDIILNPETIQDDILQLATKEESSMKFYNAFYDAMSEYQKQKT